MPEYFVDCPCGKKTPVAARQAGSSYTCKCGRLVDVPLLSVLKRNAGESNKTTIGQIHDLLQQGELPRNQICPLNGKLATHTQYFNIECERVWIQDGEPTSVLDAIVKMFLFGIKKTLTGTASSGRTEFGRETVIVVPLRLSSEAIEKCSRTRQQQLLKSLLNSEPIYAKLLQEYPDAVVSPE